jgi:integrase
VGIRSNAEAGVQDLVNRTNYHLVREYVHSIGERRMLSDSSIQRYWFYSRHLLLWAMDTPLHKADRIKPLVPGYVSSLPSPRSEGELAEETQKKIIELARGFFVWVRSTNPQEYRRISPEWIATLRPPRKKNNRNEHVFVGLDEVLQIARLKIPPDDLATRRDQASAAMLFLSGMRAGAFTTLPIEAVDLEAMKIRQWPELGVHTKNGKKATTFLFQIPELIEVAREWDCVLKRSLSSKSRWYTPVDQHWGDQELSGRAPGANRGLALDKRLRLLFSKAGLEYKSAHAVYGLLHADTMADYKAISENMMHSDIRTTDDTYAMLSSEEVRKRITGLFSKTDQRPKEAQPEGLGKISNEQLSQMLVEVARRLAG